ncbi:TetR family transcriptional regulator [Pseudonocardia sulfidoxydans NBRC 16205]|uniref:TetR family transcriptional regulator n=1 Tax=Pseudonocardia sulfidoxydans NBRC 16205 TaxID=1223511 RepID=A0A511DQ55_9PSEU|nr:TetR family transcriptional regulator [Pseudonocardia sulfidoxydans]GEL26972.1 TetR family transcriptional regulator [Pseudonocardia sulfidoxydans NBRC 16205]
MNATRRDELLAAVLEHLTATGATDLSLRAVAEAVGTSHRMLSYHFGSRDGLVLAVVQAVESGQQALAAALAADTGMSAPDQMRALWKQVSQPALALNVRLFFSLYARGLAGEEPAARLLDGDIARWVEPSARTAHEHYGLPLDQARTDVRLGVAVVRGLLLDLLATGERDAVDAAFERFVTLWDNAFAP